MLELAVFSVRKITRYIWLSIKSSRAFIKRNAAVIISLCSMVIAFQSFQYTLEAQRNDLEYKEISIMPRPSLLPLGEDMSLTLRNFGLGPAIIKQIDFAQNKKCVSSHEKPRLEWAALYAEFLQEVAIKTYNESLPPMPWTRGGIRAFNFEADILQNDDSVRPGEDRYLFRLDANTLKEFRQVIPNEQASAKNKFSNKAFEIPIVIVVCSATERTCMSVGYAEGCKDSHVGLEEVYKGKSQISR